jgi:hypothetical protein
MYRLFITIDEALGDRCFHYRQYIPPKVDANHAKSLYEVSLVSFLGY